MPEHDTAEFRPAPERTPAAAWVAATVAVCAVAAAGAWWFWQRQAEPLPAAPPPPVASAPAPPAAEPAPEPASPASGPQNPVDALAPADAALPALAESDGRVTALLNELLGPGQVAAFLQTEGFIRRTVATVDNLGRAQAPARMWPVQPLRDRFLVDGPGDAPAPIAAANAARYRAALAFAEAVPLDAAVALYARLYPLFQQAYEELGFPRGYFNDRLVAVLDHLLLAPEPRGPVRVKLLPVNTELADPRPWVRYEFEDPALQALSSGQKMLVRMGPENEARAKALIRALRQRVATGELSPRPQR
ncbi:DUF3014 domain-containing protein [Acidovorax sp. M2(2025)]|uniref:DUF3014 domain-containing protein n=1 Tax=Acidovorax sp. M2(2025) TaxID=3411355 RepID=UPI003BF47B57